MKFSKKDCIRLLWKFGEITAEVVDDALVEHIRVSNPTPATTLLGFSFGKLDYFVLFDDALNDDLDYAREQILRIYPNSRPEIVAQKADIGGFFRGKAAYLFRGEILKKRLDILTAERFTDVSRSQIVKLIKQGKTIVDGKAILVGKTMVPVDAEIELVTGKVAAKLPEIPILFENNNVLVIDKPAGVLSHAKNDEQADETLVDFLESRVNEKLLETEFRTSRTGIVHRLDRGTSGVMILAKNAEAMTMLAKQFNERKAKKTYLAIVMGKPKLDAAMIDIPIARNIKKPTTFLAHNDGRSARTKYKILATNGKSSLLELKPQTGRTHQIRVHLAFIGAPIVGDFVYNKKYADEPRPLLHAERLEITVPTDTGNERMTFVAELPDDMKQFLVEQGLEYAG
jgi:23S rRNA pseudouridine1911/1915/1917 synthase